MQVRAFERYIPLKVKSYGLGLYWGVMAQDGTVTFD